jgi:hypothetical protein
MEEAYAPGQVRRVEERIGVDTDAQIGTDRLECITLSNTNLEVPRVVAEFLQQDVQTTTGVSLDRWRRMRK